MCVRISVREYVRFNPSRGMWPCPPPAGSRTQGPAPGLRNDRWRIWNLTRALDVAHCGAGPAGTPGSHVWQVDSREKKRWKYGKAMGLYGSVSFSPVRTSMLPRSLPGEIANTMQKPHLFHLCYDKRLLGIAGGRVVSSGSREQRRRPRAGKEG
jgi:hypothetical protein